MCVAALTERGRGRVGGWEVVASLRYLIGSQTVKMVHPHARLLLLILPLLLVSMCRYV